MATVGDIDTLSAVRKFLERATIVPKEQEGADATEEVAALLETTALSFLLFPQMALSLVLQARNSLLQVVQTEIQVVDYLEKTFLDLDNPNDPITDTSDLVEAQTALVEIDKLGRLDTSTQAYNRYTSAVQRFLDDQLARYLKRHGRLELERSGEEARQDLYDTYATLTALHPPMVQRLADLTNSLSDFQSVNLTKMVSSRAVSKVRDSLSQLQTSASVLSKTVMAIELLSGSSALKSISGARSLYDPTVETGIWPEGRTLKIASELVAAQVSFGPMVGIPVGGASLSVSVDGGTEESLTIPGLVFVVGSPLTSSVTIPASRKLYLNYYSTDPSTTTILPISITSGSRTRAQLAAEIEAAMVADGCGHCYERGDRLLIVGSSALSKLTVLSYGQGTYSGGYVPPDESVHLLLGFSDNQASEAKGSLSVANLVALAQASYSSALVSRLGDQAVIATPTKGADGSLFLSGTLLPLYGLSNPLSLEAEPSYLTLQEYDQSAMSWEDVDPYGLGVRVGSKVTVLGDRGLGALVTTIDGVKLFFGSVPLPRGVELSTTIDSPLVLQVRELVNNLGKFTGVFDDVLFRLQGVLTPLLSRPTLAQINDARRVLDEVRGDLAELEAVLGGYIVTLEQQPLLPTLRQLLSGLDERNLDRSSDLLRRGRFSEFFGLSKDAASKGSRFLGAMEQLGQNELASTTREDAQQPLNNMPVAPDDNVYPGVNAYE